MNAIIVAAGTGTRLMPLTKDYPKCLFRINTKTIIDFILESLENFHFKKIVMVVGYQQEKIKDYLKDRVRYVINPIYYKTNSMYSLMCAQDYFGDGFLYLHSDIIFDESVLKQIISSEYEICLAIDKKMVDTEDMRVRIEDGLIIEINKTIPLERATGEFIGIAKFVDQGVNSIKESLNQLTKDNKNHDAYFEYAVEYLIKRGYKVYPSLSQNKFYFEIDTEEDLKKVKDRFCNEHQS